VTVSFDVTDPESPDIATVGCGPRPIEADTPGVSVECDATSYGGPAATAAVFVMRDATPPTLGDLSFPDTVDVSTGPANLTVDYKASDNLSGVACILIGFGIPEVGCVVEGSDCNSQDAVSVPLDPNSVPPGIYTVCRLDLSDAAGNSTSYTAAEL